MSELQNIINAAWEDRSNVNTQTQGDVREAVDVALAGLDCGEYRIADKSSGQWVVNDWLKKAVLLSFRLNPNRMMDAGDSVRWWDKVPLKTGLILSGSFTGLIFKIGNGRGLCTFSS